MSHDTNKNVPAIRFAGFEGGVDLKTLGDVSDGWFKGQSFQKNEIAALGKRECIHYGELFTRYGECIDNPISRTDKAAVQTSRNGDILFPASDVTPTGLARCSVILKSGVILGGDIIILRLKHSVDPVYICYAINVHRNQLLRCVSGAVVKHLSASALTSVCLTIASLTAEQSRIGQFFRALDKLIELRQKKLERLILLKKQLLNKLFPRQGQKVPDIRFAGFEGEWQGCSFIETVDIERGGSPRPIESYITRNENGLNWIKIGDAPLHGNYIESTSEKIRPEGLSKTREVHPGDLILSNSMSFGRPYIMKIDGCIHDGWLLIRNKSGTYIQLFLCYMLGTIRMLKQFEAMAAGSAVHNLNKEIVGSTHVCYPDKEEQGRIAQLLLTIDHLICILQKELEKQRTLKRALLREMFV